VHAAAVSQPNACEDDAAYSEKVNVGASRRIAKLCAANGASCVFVSTDLVFDGEHAPYAEADPAGPVNRYGEQKAAAEKEMCAVFGGVTVCRMPLMFGDPSPASHSFIQPFGEKLKRGEPLNLFTDEIRTPVSAVRASRGLLLALGFPGEVFHLGGRQRLSRFEMGLMLAEVLGADRGLLRPALRADVKMAARRPRDVSLDSSKAYAMGFEPGDTMGELVHVGM
jgi:dTDP-4-dehydrorhamnose reductase